ncbi:MAG: metallophosphoesterase family protein [Anaerolineae bacterium]|nr:metallophosphoesterase family protein [Anaerolineae bacterium]
MTQLAWLTDIHLDFLDAEETDAFCQSVARCEADAILIGGDISIAMRIQEHLLLLARHARRPIYFVLGNHDFYGGSISGVRARVARLAKGSPWLRWLPDAGVVELSPNTGLIGHGAWADGRLGNAVRSQVTLNDYFYIDELTGLSQQTRFARLNALGDQAAAYLRGVLLLAVERFRRLLLLTHVPPFKASCWHQGQISDDEFLPHFTCSVVGDLLADTMQRHPECHLTVLCGHTHSAGEASILPNLLVKTGGAAYGRPRIQEQIAVE